MPNSKLSIPLAIWETLIAQLKLRGQRKRESGAFLLGPLSGSTITDFICYDDLDPHVMDTGIIIFESYGFTPLWEYCRNNNLRVLADIHTHPGKWTGQSLSDKTNPMIVQKGHVALIVPSYAHRKRKTLTGVGIYEYLGDMQWKTHSCTSPEIKIIK